MDERAGVDGLEVAFPGEESACLARPELVGVRDGFLVEFLVMADMVDVGLLGVLAESGLWSVEANGMGGGSVSIHSLEERNLLGEGFGDMVGLSRVGLHHGLGLHVAFRHAV